MDFKEKIVEKKNKCMAKQKEQLTKLCDLIRFFLIFYSKSSLFLLFFFTLVFLPTIVIAFLFALMAAFIYASLFILLFCLGSLLFYYLILCSFWSLILNPLLFCYLIICILQLYLQIFSYLVRLLFFPAKFQLFCRCFLYLVYLFFLDFHLLEYLNNLCQIKNISTCQLALQNLFASSWFLAHTAWKQQSIYNLTNINKYKYDFNILIINSYLLNSNQDLKEVDLSSAGCRCSYIVILNRSQYLDLLDSKPVYIIKAILLTIALF